MHSSSLHCALSSARRLVLSLPLVAALGACGYKGPLYMPPPQAPDESLVTPPTSGSVPATSTESPTGSTSPQTIPVK